MKIAIKIGALCLAVLLALPLAGCQNPDWVMERGERRVPPGVYIFAMMNAYYDAKNNVEDFLYAEAESSAIVQAENDPENFDIPYVQAREITDLFKETMEDGRTPGEYITEEAMQWVKEMLAADQKFDEMGLTLSDSDQSSIDSYVSSIYDGDPDFYNRNGVSRDSLRLYLELYFRSNAVMQSLYGEGGEQELPESQRFAYLNDNYMVSRYLGCLKVDSYTGAALPEEEVALAKEKAEAYLARAVEGEDFYGLIQENTVDNLGDDSSLTPLEDAKKDLLYDSLIPNDSTDYSAELIEALQSMPYNTPTLVEDTYYYYVVVRIDPASNRAAYLGMPGIWQAAVNALAQEDFEALCATWAGETDIGINNDAIAYYKPTKLKMEL